MMADGIATEQPGPTFGSEFFRLWQLGVSLRARGGEKTEGDLRCLRPHPGPVALCRSGEKPESGEMRRPGFPLPLIQHLSSAGMIASGAAELAAAFASDDRELTASLPARFVTGQVAAELALMWRGLSAAAREQALLSVSRAISDELRAFTCGLRRYQTSGMDRRDIPSPPVFTLGSMRIFAWGNPQGLPVFITPSLVNPSDILDLTKERSLCRFLAAAGLRVYLLDWGAPESEREFSLRDYMLRRLLPAFGWVRNHHRQPPALLGYCMGGTLTVALAHHAARHEMAAGPLVLLGTPWRFDRVMGAAAIWRRALLDSGSAALSRFFCDLQAFFGVVPFELIQQVFWSLDPGLALRKFAGFARMEPEGAEAEHFVILEDWLNSGMPVAAPAFHGWIRDCVLATLPSKGRWQLLDAPVRPQEIAVPALVVAAAGDRITPLSASEPLAEMLPQARLLRADCGHVGMIAGQRAGGLIREQVARFLCGGV